MSVPASGDSAELEALFDSIAASQTPLAEAEPHAPKRSSILAAARESSEVGDSEELQALFDSVASESRAEAQPAGAAVSDPAQEGGEWPRQDQAFQRVGQMARQLHDMMRDLGYDKILEKTATAIPDARDRLAYVANLTEQAACRVLNATDVALPAQEALASSTQALRTRWDQLYANQLSVAEFKKLADDTRGFLFGELTQTNELTRAQLMEIMMAQDFQDLTGQVIKRVVALAQDLETQMMGLLIEVMPERKRVDSVVTNLMNGPVISTEGRTDVVVNQEQVDDLLDSLGF